MDARTSGGVDPRRFLFVARQFSGTILGRSRLYAGL